MSERTIELQNEHRLLRVNENGESMAASAWIGEHKVAFAFVDAGRREIVQDKYGLHLWIGRASFAVSVDESQRIAEEFDSVRLVCRQETDRT